MWVCSNCSTWQVASHAASCSSTSATTVSASGPSCSRPVLVVDDNRNRTLAYSVETGKQTGSAFGTPLDVAQRGSMVVVQNIPGQLTLHLLPLMQRLDELTFPFRATLARFQADDSQLFVLAEDQTAYVLTLGPFSGASVAVR